MRVYGKRVFMLLFDQNLSFRLPSLLEAVFPDSAHISGFSLHGATDRQVWDLAKAHRLAIVSKDVDFANFSTLYGAPPKVIWLRIGNCPTQAVASLFLGQAGAIQSFLKNDKPLLEIIMSA